MQVDLSFSRATSSPAAGLPVEEFFTVPVRVCAAVREPRKKTSAKREGHRGIVLVHPFAQLAGVGQLLVRV